MQSMVLQASRLCNSTVSSSRGRLAQHKLTTLVQPWLSRCVALQTRTSVCSSSNNGDIEHSFDDDAESGLGKLRYNKRVRSSCT